MWSSQQRPVKPNKRRGTQLVEIPVAPTRLFSGMRPAEFDLPRDVLIIAIEPGEETGIPRGTRDATRDRMLFLLRHDQVVAFHGHLFNQLKTTGREQDATGSGNGMSRRCWSGCVVARQHIDVITLAAYRARPV